MKPFKQYLKEEILSEYRPSFPAKYANKETNSVKSFKDYQEYKSFMKSVPEDKKDDWYYIPKDAEISSLSKAKSYIEKGKEISKKLKPVLNELGKVVASLPKGVEEEIYGSSGEITNKLENLGNTVEELHAWEKRNDKINELLDKYKDNKSMYESLLQVKAREKELKKQLLHQRELEQAK